MNFGICMKVSYSTFDLVKVPGIDYTDLVSHGWYTEHANYSTNQNLMILKIKF